MTTAKDFVTIVSGLPRTGTSMMMRMIEAGGIPALVDNIRQADEDNPKGYYEFEPVKKTKEDPSWVAQAVGKVVKMVHVLLLDLPAGYQYRVVFMRRRLEEVVKSQHVMLSRQGKEGGRLTPDQLMKMFTIQLAKVETFVKAQSHFRMVQINYNEILSDPAPSVQRINELLGGDLDTAAMRKVVDPSLYRQRA